jgi:hypothetical protein
MTPTIEGELKRGGKDLELKAKMMKICLLGSMAGGMAIRRWQGIKNY